MIVFLVISLSNGMFFYCSIDGKIKNVRETNLLTLADYGRCLDLTMHSEDATFIGNCNTDKFECIEMKNNLPWKYQVNPMSVLPYRTFTMCSIVPNILPSKTLYTVS